MENQHQKITGYRDLSQAEIDSMNAIKEYGEQVRVLIETLQGREELDQRWIAIGKTHMQQGFMALVRAVAKPESF